MSYIDGFVIAVPTANKQKFIEHARRGDSVFIDLGATRRQPVDRAELQVGAIDPPDLLRRFRMRHRPALHRPVADRNQAAHPHALALSRGILTRRGGRWHVSTVMNLLDRLGVRKERCASRG